MAVAVRTRTNFMGAHNNNPSGTADMSYSPPAAVLTSSLPATKSNRKARIRLS